MSLLPPECTDALLALLRSKRLLDDDALARLGAAWNGDDAPGPHIDELVAAGLLTPFQAGHVRAGRSGRLGPFRLVERLGRAVFRAEHTLLGRTVVLKVLRKRSRRPHPPAPSPAGRGGAERSSRREILAAGTLAHPHLVAAHDARWIRGRLVLVLEHVEGIDLARLLAQTGPLPVELVSAIARQTLSALDHLHRRGMVHRDVKPANLMLSHDAGAGPLVKLIDLGLVCPAGTRGEELCGTPDYLPPERGHSPDAIDIRGDLYSLGCTLYELLSGRVPFPGGTWTGKLLRHRIEVPTPLAELRPDVPAGLADVVARLMERDPDVRPASPAVVLGMMAPCARLAATRSGARGAPQRAPLRVAAKRSPFWPYVLATVLGAVLGCLGKALPPAPAVPPWTPPAVVSASTFDLAPVIASAPDGAVVELPDGEYRIDPIRVEGRSLTLRAAPGAAPRLRRAGGSRWDALLSCDRDLTLVGIDLAGEADALAPLVLVEGAGLRLERCKLAQRGASPAVSLRRGARVELERCEVSAVAQAVAVELGSGACAVRLERTRLEVREPAGPALLLWCPESDPSARAEVRLGGCDIVAGRVVACRGVGGAVLVEAEGNRLAFRRALVSLDGCGRQSDWRRVLNYAGRQNRHDATGAWLRLDGSPAGVWTEGAWAALWPAEPSGPSPAGEIVPGRDESSLRNGVRR